MLAPADGAGSPCGSDPGGVDDPSGFVRRGSRRRARPSALGERRRLGGIIEFNHDGSNLVNLTSNTFGQVTNNPDGQYKSDYASVARNGTTAFASSRGGQGWRIYVMNAVGGDVRELTKPTSAAGVFSNDLDPVISPDGSRIAFISNRAGVARQPQTTGLIDIYMVNVNGTGLRQVTKSEIGSHDGVSSIRGLVWSPTGKQIAFRGERLAPEAGGGPPDLQDVLGFISPTGGGEQDDVVGDCADAGALDWSGGRIIYTFGGSVQGARRRPWSFAMPPPGRRRPSRRPSSGIFRRPERAACASHPTAPRSSTPRPRAPRPTS